MGRSVFIVRREAVRTAARIASWLLYMKSADNLEDAMRELFRRLRQLAGRLAPTSD
jgi:hypothetical protein